MNKELNTQTGISFGVLIGMVYAILLYIRWGYADNFILYGTMAFVSFLVVLGLMFWEAFQRRKASGGYVDLKNLFQTLFISVLLFELFYAAYNFIHLKYIDPTVIERMKAGMLRMLDNAGTQISEQQREDSLKRFNEMEKALQWGQVVKSYFISVAISGFFAFIVALIMRRSNPQGEMPQNM